MNFFTRLFSLSGLPSAQEIHEFIVALQTNNSLRKEALTHMNDLISKVEQLAADVKTRGDAIITNLTDVRTQLKAAQDQIAALQNGGTLAPDDQAALTAAETSLQAADDSLTAAEQAASPAPAGGGGGTTTTTT
jgi:septation ring formation regulator EzrA